MEIQRLHQGRLIDHLQLVVRRSRGQSAFPSGRVRRLKVPIGGEGPGFFWADELFVSGLDSEAAAGKPTGRNHRAFQARDREMVDAFHPAALAAGGRDHGAPGERGYHPG